MSRPEAEHHMVRMHASILLGRVEAPAWFFFFLETELSEASLSAAEVDQANDPLWREFPSV